LEDVPVEEAVHEGDGSKDGGRELEGGDVSFDGSFGFEAAKNGRSEAEVSFKAL